MTDVVFSRRPLGAAAPRRTLYRRVKRMFRQMLAAPSCDAPRALDLAVRRFLRPLSPQELLRLLRDRHAATARAVALVTSGTAIAAPPVELSDVAAGVGGFVINGIEPGDRAGGSVSGAGDVNGDGLADLIIGAPLADPGGDSSAGESYVVFGKSGTAAVDLAVVAAGGAGAGGFVINGIDIGDWAGFSVSGAGDVNGDGLADLIVGALHAEARASTHPGECYVVFGKASTTPVELSDVAAGIGGFVINGIEEDDRAGEVSGVGDVNGDGLADLIIGARQAEPGVVVSAGESYVVFGKASTIPVELSDVAAGVGGFIINGINPFDASGSSVSGAGDVNGDGLADVIIGAPGADFLGHEDAGAGFVVYGKASTTPVELSDVGGGAGGFVITGIDPGDQCGGEVSGAGDVNGDGLADIIIGAQYADPGGQASAGESYVVFGGAGTSWVDLADVAAGFGGFVITGIDAFDRASAVAGAGDVNGDAVPDLIVGAWFADPGGEPSAGESYVVFGSASTMPVDLATVALGTGGFAINGIDAGDQSGAAVAGAGDVNGDGVADLIVGARFADPGGNSSAGEAYVIFALKPSCADDIDGSGDVGFNDVTQLLVNWGPCPPVCPWDIDGSGEVGFGDLTQILLNWGPC